MNRDRLSKARRSWNMSRIRGKNTGPEKIVRSLLHRMGYRFRLHVRMPVPARAAARNPGSKTRNVSVDIFLPGHKTAIFVHGCFWHRHKGCRNCTTPSNRREWWLAKLNGNVARDRLQQAALRKLGWRVIVIWECEIKYVDRLQRRLRRLFNAEAQRIQ